MRKKLIALIVALSFVIAAMPVLAAENSKGGGIPSGDKIFTDISGHWAEGPIVKYADPSIFAGKDGKFHPGRVITRGEFVMLLHKALGININYFKAPDIKEFFDDVDNEAPYASDLYDLVISGIVDGKGSFKPDQALPRDEMIHYIIKGLKYKTGDNYAVIMMMPAPFADDEKISSAYKNDVIEAVLLKIVFGRGRNMLFPQSGSTRAEAAAIIERLVMTARKFNISIAVTPSAEKSDTGIKLNLAMTNNSREPLTIEYSSGQKYDFVLLDSNHKELYRWSSDKLFMMLVNSTVLDAGKTLEFTETLDGDTYKAIKYKIKYMRAYVTGKIDSYTFNPDGYEVEIK